MAGTPKKRAQRHKKEEACRIPGFGTGSVAFAFYNLVY
jgi:hypothetical protein